ncbi:hypothetical protein [Cerasicoccus frondis]|uniref:hypothetical protein n=1 Tax=Cerasicoccus frondis TaxID=490090 RepID=UPI0028526BD4|nr:hypothetical protein [Cerasicoccus frondis]
MSHIPPMPSTQLCESLAGLMARAGFETFEQAAEYCEQRAVKSAAKGEHAFAHDWQRRADAARQIISRTKALINAMLPASELLHQEAA